jgi:glycosyltransferase involved in cell wall biosynthesis
MSVVVSIIVPTYHRTQSILRCLDALLSQEFEPAEYEIIVVDNAACEETRRAVAAWEDDAVAQRCLSHTGLNPARCEEESFYNGTASTATMTRDTVTVVADIPEVRYIPANGKRGPAAARNCGWRAARGDIIAFTDDDCLPDPEWLRSGVQAIQNGHDGAYGRVIVPLPNHPTDYEKDTLGLERSEFITANCFYHRSVLAAAGGFDERFTMAWREDSDLYFRLLKMGCDLVYVDSALVYHPVRPARWAISIHQQKKAMFNALLYKKHARLYRAKIQRRPPWHYYLATAGLAAGIAGIIAQYSLVGWLGLLTWLLSTAAFCLVRLKGTSKHLRHIAEMVVTSVLIPPLAVFWRLRGALKFKVFFF